MKTLRIIVPLGRGIGFYISILLWPLFTSFLRIHVLWVCRNVDTGSYGCWHTQSRSQVQCFVLGKCGEKSPPNNFQHPQAIGKAKNTSCKAVRDEDFESHSRGIRCPGVSSCATRSSVQKGGRGFRNSPFLTKDESLEDRETNIQLKRTLKIHICIYICICIHIYICIYIYIHIHIYIYIS